ncbi:transposase, partial [Maribrevibacterium harenarium]
MAVIMFGFSDSLPVVLICGVTDMRKSIDGLAYIVAYDLEMEPCSEKLFV